MKQMELFECVTSPETMPEELFRSSVIHPNAECKNISFVFKYRGVAQYLSAEEAISLHQQLGQFVEDLEAIQNGRK